MALRPRCPIGSRLCILSMRRYDAKQIRGGAVSYVGPKAAWPVVTRAAAMAARKDAYQAELREPIPSLSAAEERPPRQPSATATVAGALKRALTTYRCEPRDLCVSQRT